MSLYHSECLGFFDALSWLYGRPRGVRVALLPSRKQIILRRGRAESVGDRAWTARAERRQLELWLVDPELTAAGFTVLILRHVHLGHRCRSVSDAASVHGGLIVLRLSSSKLCAVLRASSTAAHFLP
jgi:hypothetical protein